MSRRSLGQPLSRLVKIDHIVLFAIVITMVAARFRLIGLPLERDEGEYAYAGQLILQGIPPGTTGIFYNMKLPGTYLAYAGIMWIFGQSPSGIRLGLLLTDAVSVVLFWKLATRLLDRQSALVGCASLAIMLWGMNVLGPMAHATHFVVFWVLAGLLLLWSRIGMAHSVSLGLGGLALGMGVLMKQPGAGFCLYGLGVLVAHDWRSGISLSRSVQRAIWFSAGVVTPYLITCAILYHCNVFPRFWFWTVTYARVYAGEADFSGGLQQLSRIWNYSRPAECLLVFLSLVGMLQISRDVRRQPFAGCLLAFSIVSLISVSLDLRFRAHYFVMLLPAMAIQIAYLFTTSARPLLPIPRRLERLGLLAILMLSFIQPIWQQWRLLLVAPPYTVLRALYGSEADDFTQAVAVARFLADHTTETDRILDFGVEPELFFYSHRQSATGYIYTYSLAEDQPLSAFMQQQFMAEAASAHPKYIVYETDSLVYGTANEKRLASWVQQFIQSHYKLAAAGVMTGDRAVILPASELPEGVWAFPMYIFARKD